MRRLFALGLAVWLVSAGLFALPSQQAFAQNGPILGEAPYLEDGAVIAASAGDIVTAASVPAVDTSSRAASASFYYSYYTSEPNIGWTGSHASCNAGATSAAFKAAVIDRIAYYRAMAGVPSAIGLSETSSAADQQAALMFSRNGQLSHSPSSNWTCYTASGAQAAANSNIALGVYGTSAIDAYMRDAGGGNTAVGHRRWVLYPQTQSFGTGDVPGVGNYASSNALWAWDSNVVGPRPSTRDGFVAWPPSGYVPYQVVFGRWSFSYPNAGFSSASVTVTRDGVNVPVSIDSTTATGYGENTIVFQPYSYGDGASWPNPGTDQTYTVKIAGVNADGQNRTFIYNVTIFDPATAAPPTTPSATPTRTATPTATRTPTRTPTGAPSTATNIPTNAPTTIPGGFAPGDLVKITANLNMRSGPGTSYARIAMLPRGTMGEVTGSPVFANGYTWYPITAGGYGSGWAAGEYFDRVSPIPSPTPTETPATAPTATRTPTQGPQPPTSTPTRTRTPVPQPPTSTPTRTRTPVPQPPTSTPTRTRTPVPQPPTSTPTPTSAAATRVPGGFLPGDTVRTTARVNFRSGPGTNYGVVSVVSWGTLATITGPLVENERYSWYPMSIAGVGSGWIASNYLTLVSMGNAAPTSMPTPVGGIGVGETVYTTTNLNIRSGPGTGYSAIGLARKGTAAIVTGTAARVGSTYWFPLDVNGIGNGWASGAYLSPAPTVQGPQLPAWLDPDDDRSVEDAAAPEIAVPATSTPMATIAPTETPTVVDLITATATLEATETVEQVETSAPVSAIASPDAATEDAAVAADPTEAPAAAPTLEPTPDWLPVERVQRSPDSQPGQVLVDEDPTTVWSANGAGQPLAMFVLDLGQESAFSHVTWLSAETGLGGALYLSVSSDGENWIDLDPTLAYTNDDGWQVLDIPVSGQFVRFVFVNDNGSEWLGGIAEVRIMP